MDAVSHGAHTLSGVLCTAPKNSDACGVSFRLEMGTARVCWPGMGVISALLVTVFSPAATGELQHAKDFW